MPGRAAGVVLDTNAWLDLLVFRDPAMAAIDAAREAGHVEFLLDDAGRDELRRVLGYPALALDARVAHTLLAGAEACARRCASPTAPAGVPRCRDHDDQSFLDLAAASGARWLLTRDAELLRLASRMRRLFGVDVIAPADWTPARLDQISKR